MSGDLQPKFILAPPNLVELLGDELGGACVLFGIMTAAVVLKVLWLKYRSKHQMKKSNHGSRKCQASVRIATVDQSTQSNGDSNNNQISNSVELNQEQDGMNVRNEDRLSYPDSSESDEPTQQFYEHRGILYHLYPAPTLSGDYSQTFPTYPEAPQVHRKSSIVSVMLPDDLPPNYEDLSEAPQFNKIEMSSIISVALEESPPPSYGELFQNDFKSERNFSGRFEIMV